MAIDLSDMFKEPATPFLLSPRPARGEDVQEARKIDHVYYWKSTTRNAANAEGSGRPA
jgi:hypothetical protein